MDTEFFPYTMIVHETEAAWLVEIEGDEHWLPKSICDVNEDAEEVEIPNWLAEEKGLIL